MYTKSNRVDAHGTPGPTRSGAARPVLPPPHVA